MTEDIQKLDNMTQIKPCETCKCLTCKSGKMFNGTGCPKGKNCQVCNGKDPVGDCQNYVSGF